MILWLFEVSWSRLQWNFGLINQGGKKTIRLEMNFKMWKFMLEKSKWEKNTRKKVKIRDFLRCVSNSQIIKNHEKWKCSIFMLTKSKPKWFSKDDEKDRLTFYEIGEVKALWLTTVTRWSPLTWTCLILETFAQTTRFPVLKILKFYRKYCVHLI